MKMQGNGNKKRRIKERASIRRIFLERVKGVEPSYKAWEAFILPLNYTRNSVSLNEQILANCLPHCQYRNNSPSPLPELPRSLARPVAARSLAPHPALPRFLAAP